MIRLRRVPPAHTPVPLTALAAGLRALVRPDPALRDRMAERVARHFGARRVVFTDSGTSALTLALNGISRVRDDGDSVALPAFGCYDLLTAARGAGVEAQLYDLDPRTLSPDLDSLERVLDNGAAAIVVAHLYGVPVDLDAVERRASDAGAVLVEDAAQGTGASYHDRPLGAYGAVSVLSFGRGKGLGGGGGGALLAHDEIGTAVLEAAGSPSPSSGRGGLQLASAAAQWALGRPSLYGLPVALPFLELGETVYRSPRRPAVISRTCLAVLEETWEPCLREAERRRARARRLLPGIRDAGDLRVPDTPEAGRAGYLRLPAVVRAESARLRLSSREARRRGVMPSYPKPLFRLRAFGAHAADGLSWENDFSGAEKLAAGLFTLPVHSRMSAADMAGLRRLLDAR